MARAVCSCRHSGDPPADSHRVGVLDRAGLDPLGVSVGCPWELSDGTDRARRGEGEEPPWALPCGQEAVGVQQMAALRGDAPAASEPGRGGSQSQDVREDGRVKYREVVFETGVYYTRR